MRGFGTGFTTLHALSGYAHTFRQGQRGSREIGEERCGEAVLLGQYTRNTALRRQTKDGDNSRHGHDLDRSYCGVGCERMDD